jgi:hypothetical protein
MSMRTIVEFNHDYAHVISGSPEEFVQLLRYALNSGDKREWDELDRFGVRRAVMTHHSSDRAAVVNGDEFPFL